MHGITVYYPDGYCKVGTEISFVVTQTSVLFVLKFTRADYYKYKLHNIHLPCKYQHTNKCLFDAIVVIFLQLFLFLVGRYKR